MNLKEFEVLATEKNYEEHPYGVYGGQTELKHFVDYDSADIDLKIHMAKVILYRNFSAADGQMVLSDHYWFIEKFLLDYKEDFVKPWESKAIKKAMSMIINKDFFDYIIGATFMFGIIEFYAKSLLGWKPTDADFFDEVAQGPFREMPLAHAINKIKKTNTELAFILNKIDKQSKKRLKERSIVIDRWVTPKIADRLMIARNTMLHGEHHGFSHIGTYLCMLYILFYLCDKKKKDKML